MPARQGGRVKKLLNTRTGMILMINSKIKDKELQSLLASIGRLGLRPFPVKNGEDNKVVVVGKTAGLEKTLRTLPHVEALIQTDKPYELASRQTKKDNTRVKVGNTTIGDDQIVVMAGPCSIESKKQILRIARSVKKAGAHFLRGGAYKPRTAPYSFQGLEKIGLTFLKHAAKKTGLKVITEVLDPRDVELINLYTDIFQVGTRNMQNYSLLKELGRANKPVLLKRGMWASYKEFLLAAEYILAGGNTNVILCERGIRTHVHELRFNLDLNSIPYLKKESHLPIIIDPSHGTGRRDLVRAMSRAAIAAGADGLIIEVHFSPDQSVSDADQTIDLEELERVIKDVQKVAEAVGKKLHHEKRPR